MSNRIHFFEGKGLTFIGEAKYDALDISNSDGRFRLWTHDGWKGIHWGDFIVKNDDGTFDIEKE